MTVKWLGHSKGLINDVTLWLKQSAHVQRRLSPPSDLPRGLVSSNCTLSAEAKPSGLPHLPATANPEARPAQIHLQVHAKVCRAVFSKPSSLLASSFLVAQADSNLVSKTSFYGPRQVQEARLSILPPQSQRRIPGEVPERGKRKSYPPFHRGVNALLKHWMSTSGHGLCVCDLESIIHHSILTTTTRREGSCP